MCLCNTFHLYEIVNFSELDTTIHILSTMSCFFLVYVLWYNNMSFSLFSLYSKGGWSSCTQFHFWWIQNNTVKIWMKHLVRKLCFCWLRLFALQSADILTCHIKRTGATNHINNCFVVFRYVSGSCQCDITRTLKVKQLNGIQPSFILWLATYTFHWSLMS